MKLLKDDFIRIMKTYKSLKTILKSERNQVTINPKFTQLDFIGANKDGEPQHSQILINNIGEVETDVNFDSECLEKLVKLKVKDEVEITDKVFLDGKAVTCNSSEEPIEFIDTKEYAPVFTCKAADFKAALKAVSVATATETSRPVLTNVFLDVDTLVAVDGYRIFTRKLEYLFVSGDNRLLIKPHTVKMLLKLLPNKGEEMLSVLQRDNTKYAITFGEYTIIDSLGVGEFLKWQQVLTDDSEYILTCNRADFIDELEWVVNCSDGKAIVKISLKEDEIMVGEKTLKCEYIKHQGAPGKHFNDLIIAFNPKYLIESLKSYADEKVNLRFISSLTPVIINDKDLILPVRLNV